MTKDERLKLQELSKKAFGNSSKWQKLMEKGELMVGTSVNKKGEAVKVRTYERVSLEQVIKVMNDLIAEKEKELAAKKEKENV